jgi:hypothetical protein
MRTQAEFDQGIADEWQDGMPASATKPLHHRRLPQPPSQAQRTGPPSKRHDSREAAAAGRPGKATGRKDFTRDYPGYAARPWAL